MRGGIGMLHKLLCWHYSVFLVVVSMLLLCPWEESALGFCSIG